MTGNNCTILCEAFDRAITRAVERRVAEEKAKQVQQNATAIAVTVETAPVVSEENKQDTSSLTARMTPYISMAKCAASKLAIQVRPTLEQVRTNLSSFYASFDVNQYVDTDKLKLNASSCYRASKVQGLSFYAKALSYSEKFLDVVQKIYTQVVKSASEHFSK